MHDLCLPRLARGATLTGVTIGAGLIQDPDGDPNLAQRFKLAVSARESQSAAPHLELQVQHPLALDVHVRILQ